MNLRAAAVVLGVLAAAPVFAQEDVAPETAEPAATAAPDTAPAGNTAHAAAAPIRLTAEQEARARSLEDRLKCPVCRSQSVRRSRSFMAEDMQRKIREMVAAGRSDEEILGWFVARFGPYILLEPPRRGFNWVAYLLPFAVVGAGAAGVFAAARRRGRAAAAAAPAAPAPPASPYTARLERELEEIR